MANANDAEISTTAFFEHLKPYCSALLDLLQNPTKNPSFISDFARFLRLAPPSALQSCFDYTMFPLLLVLAASRACRGKQNGSSSRNFVTFNSPCVLYLFSDKVTEGVLQCLEEALRKCPLSSVDHVIVLF